MRRPKALNIETRIAASPRAAATTDIRIREKRIKPFRDEKVLTAWNGLMLAAFAEATAILDVAEYVALLEENAEFLMKTSAGREAAPRTWKDGKAKLNAYIEDYANLADGLIELFQVSGDLKYLHEANRLAGVMIDEFWDKENGGFYFTSDDHEQLIVRTKDFFDNATPSGNSVAADVLLKLSKFFDREDYSRYAATVLRLVSPQVSRYPNGFGRALGALEFCVGGTSEIVIFGSAGSELERAVWKNYLPRRILLLIDEDAPVPELPLTQGRQSIDGKPTAYVCKNFVCERPVTTAEELEVQLVS